MILTINDLIALAPPPAMPIDPGKPDQWQAVEQSLGVKLPEDYKAIINTYGSGDFGDFLIILNPFSRDAGMNLLCQINFDTAEQAGVNFNDVPLLEQYKETKDDLSSDQHLFPAYPEYKGLLPVARCMNGGDMFWQTNGPQSDWSLVLYDWRGGSFHETHLLPLVDFLVLWLSGELPDSFFGMGNSPVIRKEPVFKPVVVM